MTDLEMRKMLATRIVAYLDPVPTNAIQGLVGQSVGELEVILEKLVTTKAQGDSEEAALVHTQETERQSKADHAWAHALLKVELNGRHLQETEANKNILEGMLQPHEEPSPALYSTLLKQFSNQFSWEVPQPIKSAADREAEFVKTCHNNLLSLCDANRQMHKDGVALENWAGATGVERAQYANEAAIARQEFLITQATPQQLKQEAAYESQVNREAAQRAEADRQHQVSSQQQSGMFPPLPATHAETGETIDARWLRKTSTIHFDLFKKLCKRHGSAAITSRLRREN